MKNNKMNAIVISDVHIGNNRIDDNKMLKALRDVFCSQTSQNALIDSINTFFIAGDLWDRLLSLNHPNLDNIINSLTFILRECKRRMIRIYVLEGTKSHEWAQSELLVSLNRASGIEADLYYIKELSIWHDDRFNMDLLFVPDDLHHDHSIIYSQVDSKLKEKQLEQVDLAIMHGMFKHQVPANLNLPCHDNTLYENIVRYGIFIGHVHLRSELGKIYAQGSFGRISHNEEDPKGYYHFWFDEQHVFHTEFIENTQAELFITVDCSGLDTSQTLAKVQEVVRTVGEDVTLRIKSEASNPIFSNLSELYNAFPMVRFSEPKKIVEKKKVKKVELKHAAFIPTVINKDNIGSLIHERLKRKDFTDPKLLTIITKAVEELR